MRMSCAVLALTLLLSSVPAAAQTRQAASLFASLRGRASVDRRTPIRAAQHTPQGAPDPYDPKPLPVPGG
jgi:hypothetical protein